MERLLVHVNTDAVQEAVDAEVSQVQIAAVADQPEDLGQHDATVHQQK